MPILGIQAAEILPAAIDFLFPSLCSGCGEYTFRPGSVCKSCSQAIHRFNRPICSGCHKEIDDSHSCPNCGPEELPLMAVGEYQGVLKEVVTDIKFRAVREPCCLFADEFKQLHGDFITGLQPDYIVPIPLHAAREYFRGYNQAAILAAQISNVLDIPLLSDLLVRTKGRRPQSRLERDHRATNVRGVFSVLANDRASLRLLLVDDVVTSGSTAREAALTLSKAGHRPVGVIALAFARHLP